MGIKGLLKQLPGGRDKKSKFSSFANLKNKQTPVHLDTGTLVFVCAVRHREKFCAGNFTPSLQEFHKTVVFLHSILKWDIKLVFDGVPPKEKEAEHARRYAGENGNAAPRIPALFIAMCAKICDRYYIPFVVAPLEADMQAGRGTESAVIMCRDSDLVGCGAGKILIVDSWGKEDLRFIDMDTPLTDDVANNYPLYAAMKRYGIIVVHWWAAVMGCDVTENGSGIRGIGPEAFFKALNLCTDAGYESLTTDDFAAALWNCSAGNVAGNHSVEGIVASLTHVVDWFTKGGTYYDGNGNICSIAGGRLVQQTSIELRTHMTGKSNPRTKTAFSKDEQKKLDGFQPHNIRHNSMQSRSNIIGIGLPDGKSILQDCTCGQLNNMVLARGGNVTGKDGGALKKAELVAHLKRYMFMEKQRPVTTAFFDRNKHTNGIFSKIDTSHNKTTPDILQQLVKAQGFEKGLRDFFVDINKLHEEGRFTDDFDTIVSEAPEMHPDFIVREFQAIGNEQSQKNLSEALKRVQESQELLYHAIAWSSSKKSIYVLSKCRASQRKEEKTRKLTGLGEKPLFQEYLVLLQIIVEETTYEQDGHTLGRFSRLMRHYCAACQAGCGLCYHKAVAMWTQYHHWGIGRPTPKPATLSSCSWIAGMKGPRSCNVTNSDSDLMIENLPGTQEAAKARIARDTKRSANEGYPGKYDIFLGKPEKRQKMDDPNYTHIDRLSPLFKAIREANRNGLE